MFSIKWNTLTPEAAIVRDREMEAFGWKLIGKVRSSKHTLDSTSLCTLKIKVTNRTKENKDENFHLDSF